MIETLALPLALREQLEQEARSAYPHECCGLIEGVRTPREMKGEATALHPTPNLSNEPDRFEIDPATHFALLRKLRGTGHDIIGCYHSHPNGRAEPSARDMEGAAEANFLWLVVSVESATAPIHLACFAWTGSAFARVTIE
jgi:proteasome lid subunit RPN8/RPN11